MFIPKTREKILKLYFNNPNGEIHQREISRQANVVPHNVNKYLKEFIRDGLLKRREISNMTFFKINPDNEYLFKVFELFEISRRKEFLSRNKKIARVLNEYTSNLIRLSNREIQMVILFGSVARGKWAKGSDLDILTVTSKIDNQRKIIQIHEEAERKISHLAEIATVNVTVDKFIKGTRSQIEFYNELWRDRIVLYNEFLFWQIIREAKLSE